MGQRTSRNRKNHAVIRAIQQPDRMPFWQDAPEVDVIADEDLPELQKVYGYSPITEPELSWKLIDLPFRQVQNMYNDDQYFIRFSPFFGIPLSPDVDEKRWNEAPHYYIKGNFETNLLGEGSFGRVIKYTNADTGEDPGNNTPFPRFVALKKFTETDTDVLQELFALSYLTKCHDANKYIAKFFFMFSVMEDDVPEDIGYAMEVAELNLLTYMKNIDESNPNMNLKAVKKLNEDTYETRINFVKQLILGLQFLHTNDTVHLDIKPNNVLLFRDAENKGLIAKLADFGRSHILKEIVVDTSAAPGDEEGEVHAESVKPSAFHSFSMFGAPYVRALESYLSFPFLLRNKVLLRSADVYSLGVLIQLIIHNKYLSISTHLDEFYSFTSFHGYAPFYILEKLAAAVFDNIDNFPKIEDDKRKFQRTMFVDNLNDFLFKIEWYTNEDEEEKVLYENSAFFRTETEFDAMVALDYSSRNTIEHYAKILEKFEKKERQIAHPLEYFKDFGKRVKGQGLEKDQFTESLKTDSDKYKELLDRINKRINAFALL
jgi:serine/threonine protein kinase